MARAVERLDGRSLPMAAHLLTQAERAALLHSPRAAALAAVEDGVCVGAVLFEAGEGLLRLRSLTVSPSRRRAGVGTELVLALRALARRAGQTLAVPFAAAGQGDGVYRLLARLHFAIARREGFTAEADAGQAADFCRRYGDLAARPPELLFRQSPGARAALAERLAGDWPHAADALRFAPGQFSRTLSCCQVRGGAIQAVCLMAEEGRTADLRLLYGAPGRGPLAMAALGASLAQVAKRPEIGRLTMTVTTPEAQKILDRLCGSYTVTRRLYTAYDLGDERGAQPC